MEVFIIGNKKTLITQIAEQFRNQINLKANSTFCLSTGSSPLEVYQKLVWYHQKQNLSFIDVETFNLDEYLEIDVKKNSLSFHNFMYENLFKDIDIKNVNTHFPKTIKSYNDMLDGIEQFDLTLLGVGVNGHIAFNEPESKIERTRIIELSQSTIKTNFISHKIIDYPTTAITMGLFDIYEKSNEIILLAWGEEKRAALLKFQEAKESGVKDPNWPITYFIDHPNFKIYTDLKF